MSWYNDLSMQLKGRNGALMRLLLINSVLFLVVNLAIGIGMLSGVHNIQYFFVDILDLPGSLSQLLVRFWTPITYMFVHYGFFHLLSNMLWLFFIGRMFSDLLGGARLTGLYVLGGLTGAALFILVAQLLPGYENADLKGASGSVMAVVIGMAAYRPDATVFPFGIEMRLKWLALIAFVLTTLLDLPMNLGGKAAHLGGALIGLWYGWQLRTKGHVLEGWSKIFVFPKTKLRVEHLAGKRAPNTKDPQQIRRKIDEILDKISRSGYDSLSKEEKEYLKANHDKF
jgi:membrane associated rhomboid family serine protease